MIANDINDLVRAGFLKFDTQNGPVRVSFPFQFRERLFTNLFADIDIDAPEAPALGLAVR